MRKLKVGLVLKSSVITICILLLVTSQSFCQHPILSYVKINGSPNVVIKIDDRQLKIIFLNDIGVRISESGFYDSLSSDNYIYKRDHNGSEQNKYFYNVFLINKTQDSAIFQLENKSSYLKKNIGAKININNWLKEEDHIIKETDEIKKLFVAYVFYSYCPYCVKRLISFDSLSKKSNSFHFFAAMLDSSKSVIRFYKRNKFSFHFAVKQEILCSALPSTCDEAPFFLLIDNSGEIIDCFDGNEKGIERITQLLE